MFRTAFLCLVLAFATPAAATEAGWALLRDGGQVVLLAHAYASSSSESADFDLEKCATQRNLTERGKQQARKIGALFAARAADIDSVLSSRYCRCLDTATIAFRDEPEQFDALDLLPADVEAARAQNARVLDAIRAFSGSGNLVMITHPANVQALTGVTPREGEAVIVRPDGESLHVLGRIVFN